MPLALGERRQGIRAQNFIVAVDIREKTVAGFFVQPNLEPLGGFCHLRQPVDVVATDRRILARHQAKVRLDQITQIVEGIREAILGKRKYADTDSLRLSNCTISIQK